MIGYVLVVEDESALRELIALEVESCTRLVVRTAKSARGAIEVMDCFGVPELIISDHVMFDGDGIYLARYCAEKYSTTPFVLCSAAEEEDLFRQVGTLRAVLRKPISFEKLGQHLTQWIASKVRAT